jgi:DNA adenine methylase
MTQYAGGKTKLGKEIYEIIKEFEYQHGYDNLIYFEPFCGMAGVMRHFAEDNRKIIASDINLDLILMWKKIQQRWLPPKNCSEIKYNKLKNSTTPSAERGFYGFACSFGGYFFGSFADKYRKNKDSVELGIRGISKIIPYINNIKFKHGSYDKYTPKNSLIYCDPPYKDNKISNKHFINFDTDKFWNVMRKWSKNNIVFISEREAPSDFICIWSKSPKQNYSKGNVKSTDECLFIHESYDI